jgi:hypothetical protein
MCETTELTMFLHEHYDMRQTYEGRSLHQEQGRGHHDQMELLGDKSGCTIIHKMKILTTVSISYKQLTNLLVIGTAIF